MRWNLKETNSEIPTRRTEITYEAILRLDESAAQDEIRSLRKSADVYVAGAWEESGRSYPGRPHLDAEMVSQAVKSGLRDEESAEAIVSRFVGEGLNNKRG